MLSLKNKIESTTLNEFIIWRQLWKIMDKTSNKSINGFTKDFEQFSVKNSRTMKQRQCISNMLINSQEIEILQVSKLRWDAAC